MDLEGLYNLLALCLDEMPKHYPKPCVIVHQSSEVMVKYVDSKDVHEYQRENKCPPEWVEALADSDNNAIHLTYKTIYTKDVMELLDVVLHECAHLYYAKKFGNNSPQFVDESLANKFSKRWCKILKSKIKSTFE